MHDTHNLPATTDMASLTELATAVAKSGLFAMKTVEQAITLMALCRSEGLDPIQACRRYHIINNRPAMRADAMQAEFQSRGGKIKWIHRDAEKCEAEFSHPSGGSVTVLWTLEMAREAGLLNNDNWRKYKRQMLHARVVSEGVRAVLPEVVCGVHTPEEVGDFGDHISKVTAPVQPPVGTTITRKPAATKPQATDAVFVPVEMPPSPGEGKAPLLSPDAAAITPLIQSAPTPVEGEFTPVDKSPAAQTSQPAGGRGQPQPTATTNPPTNPPTSPAPGVSDAIQKLLDAPIPEELNAQRALMTQMGVEIVKFSKETWEAIKADWKNSTSTTARRNMIEKTKTTLQELCA